MKSCTLQWLVVAAAMIIFTLLALSGHWADLGMAITAVAVLWYVVVPEQQARRQ